MIMHYSRAVFLFSLASQLVWPSAATAQNRRYSREEIGEIVRLQSLARDPDSLAEYATKIPNEERLKWIQLLHGYDPSIRWDDSAAANGRDFKSLLALGDDDTGHWLIEQYKNDHSRNEPFWQIIDLMANWRTAEGLAFMAGLTFSNETYKVSGGDFKITPVSFYATNRLLEHMLPKAYLLPESVRKWASQLEHERLAAYSEICDVRDAANIGEDKASADFVHYRGREIAQTWWKANEQAIKAQHWNEVKPGENYHGPKFNALLERLKSGNPIKVPTTISTKHTNEKAPRD
jgi:hypothetical protein